MKWMKLIGVAIVNAAGGVIALMVVGNFLHALGGHFAVSVLVCLALLTGVAECESRKLEVPVWKILGLSVLITAVAAIGIVVAVTVVIGDIW